MGMDVDGENPTSERGEYFRNNIWWWHPLWDFCEYIAPDLIPETNLGHTNDGWGLNARDSISLADRIDQAIADGTAKEFGDRVNASSSMHRCGFAIVNVKEFSAFLRSCGGFAIW
ncbi:hypothetical protein [Magnetospirillum sp. ME-1]|uniref:hypothetical protein n=1 Tax=Magnetospirillum sp. ME-1 TaxID=1639348 RepID=UPI0011AEBC8F|nr:hypothetical protein [Magnetospirillum sp. ME-1]